MVNRTLRSCILAFIALNVGFVGSAKADLASSQAPRPDLWVAGIEVDYNYLGGGTGLLTATSTMPLTYLDLGVGGPIMLDMMPPRSFALTATVNVDQSTGQALGIQGTLNVTGEISSLGFTSGTLLTGDITQFEAPGSDGLVFLFDVTGGDAASQYGPRGLVNMISTGYGATPDFRVDFGAMFSAQADIAGVLVPEPASATFALMGAVGLLGYAGRRRRLRKRRCKSTPA